MNTVKEISTIAPLTRLERYETWKAQWQSQEGLGLLGFISDEVHPEDALAFCKVLYPDFVEVNGMVFLEWAFSQETYNLWVAKFEGDSALVEKMMNHTHVYDLFGGCSGKISDLVFEQLFNVLIMSWQMSLNRTFPGRKVNVVGSNSEQDYGPTITFYQDVI